MTTDNWYGQIPANTVYYPAELQDQARLLARDLGVRRLHPAIAADELRPHHGHPHRRSLTAPRTVGSVPLDTPTTADDGPRRTVERRCSTTPPSTLLAVDFDGVLAPIVDDPDQAHVHPDAVPVLSRVASRLGAVAVVTGRPAEQARAASVASPGPTGSPTW